jgi:hypothetical protein
LDRVEQRYAAIERTRPADMTVKHHYSKKIMTWQAAYDALRELGVPIEEGEINHDIH